MLCYHQHLYPMCTKMMCLSVWQVGPWVSPGATSLQGAAWNPLASWILLAPKNWKRGWWQAARKDWLVTCTHRYHLRPVPRAGRGFRTSSVWQERRMRPVEQHTGGGGGGQPGWRGVGVWSRTSAPPHLPKPLTALWAAKHPTVFAVRILHRLWHVLEGVDFWTQTKFSSGSPALVSEQDVPAGTANSSRQRAQHGAWASFLTPVVLCFEAWNVIIITVLLSYLPWVLCPLSHPLGAEIAARKNPLGSLKSSWSIWLDGLPR